MACLFFKDFVCFFCACFNFGLCLGLIISMNVLFTDWMTSFDADRGSTVAVQATCFGLNFGAGLIAGMLEAKLGSRVCMLLGAVLAAGGYLAGAFVTSLPALIVSVGVVTGCGSCLLQLSTMSTAVARFHRKAVFISSGMMSSISLMNLVLPLVYRYLSEHYTWRGCLIFASAAILHTAILSLLLTSPIFEAIPTPTSQPLTKRSVNTTDRDINNQSDVTNFVRVYNVAARLSASDLALYTTCDVKAPVDVTESCSTPDISKLADKDAVVFYNLPLRESVEKQVYIHPATKTGFHEQNKCCDEDGDATSAGDTGLPADNSPDSGGDFDSTWVARLKSVLTDPLYVGVLLCNVTYLATCIGFLFLVMDLAAQQGWTKDNSMLLNFVFQLSGLVTRVLFAVISVNVRLHSIVLLIASGVIGSVGLMFVGQVSSFHLAAVFYATLGSTYGGVACCYPAAILKVVGRGLNYPVALGLNSTMEGILVNVVSILTGVWVDVHQSYSVVSLIYGILSLAACLLLTGVFLYRRHGHVEPNSTYCLSPCSSPTDRSKSCGMHNQKQ